MLLVLAPRQLGHLQLLREDALQPVEPLAGDRLLLVLAAEPHLDAVSSCTPRRDDTVDLPLEQRTRRRRALRPGRRAFGLQQVGGDDFERRAAAEEDEALVDRVEEGARGRDGDAAALCDDDRQ